MNICILGDAQQVKDAKKLGPYCMNIETLKTMNKKINALKKLALIMLAGENMHSIDSKWF